jgi:CDP-4-dehydro-6-deoxyglucose reductase
MRVALQPSGAVLDVSPGESILAAAQRTGHHCPQSCRNGNCHVCAALLVSGSVRQDGQLRTHGEIYTCIAEPLQDCELLWDGVLVPGELPVRQLACQVTECLEVGGDVWRVRLRAPAGKPPRYHAGQYLMLERDNGDKSAFSLASAPGSGRDLELHLLVREAGTRQLIEQLQRDGMVRVELPYGDTHLAELPAGPLILIAAGTGMAQMQALIEHCRASGFNYPVHLYWGARRPEDFYHLEHWETWKRVPNLFVHQVVSDRCHWEGRCGLLHEAVRADMADLSNLHVYASGSPAMVYATLDALVEAGMDAHQMRADVFSYAPRP